MINKENLEKFLHDVESHLSQAEFAFHEEGNSPSEKVELEKIFTNAIQRIRACHRRLKEIAVEGNANENAS